MTRILITSPMSSTVDSTADIVVIAGDYAATPVKGIFKANMAFSKPVVLIAGLQELDGDNRTRRLSEGRRHSRKSGKTTFLERDTALVGGVRFIGMHKPDNDFILEVLSDPFDGPTVIVTYDGPREDIDAITLTGKVSRWIHAGSTTTEPLVVEV